MKNNYAIQKIIIITILLSVTNKSYIETNKYSIFVSQNKNHVWVTIILWQQAIGVERWTNKR